MGRQVRSRQNVQRQRRDDLIYKRLLVRKTYTLPDEYADEGKGSREGIGGHTRKGWSWRAQRRHTPLQRPQAGMRCARSAENMLKFGGGGGGTINHPRGVHVASWASVRERSSGACPGARRRPHAGRLPPGLGWGAPAPGVPCCSACERKRQIQAQRSGASSNSNVQPGPVICVAHAHARGHRVHQRPLSPPPALSLLSLLFFPGERFRPEPPRASNRPAPPPPTSVISTPPA